MRRRSDSGKEGEVPKADKKPKAPRSAFDKALGLLARREHSQRELRQKLNRGGFARDESTAAVERLGDLGYQDDSRFAEVLVRSRIGQGYGPARIRAELKSQGISDAAIRELLEAADVDWRVLASSQLRRRYGGTSADPAERARRAQFLLRRGFAAATVRGLTHADVDDTDDD
ncbi:regulatory protein [Luteibacter rhizovicinus]|uniref:Regulatory protein RecX n=1 Tax=Luteibacter rhizovicinus TaxID=242606 RepID=A0A4R3YXF8_9GAMM|nr:regulatory protein RecX [Luteibacter rhizovicinus]TCV97236.1 regulatory protein [Luteibacter rhizovicinus]